VAATHTRISLNAAAVPVRSLRKASLRATTTVVLAIPIHLAQIGLRRNMKITWGLTGSP
jgi:hypothetical protein